MNLSHPLNYNKKVVDTWQYYFHFLSRKIGINPFILKLKIKSKNRILNLITWIKERKNKIHLSCSKDESGKEEMESEDDRGTLTQTGRRDREVTTEKEG